MSIREIIVKIDFSREHSMSRLLELMSPQEKLTACMDLEEICYDANYNLLVYYPGFDEKKCLLFLKTCRGKK